MIGRRVGGLLALALPLLAAMPANAQTRWIAAYAFPSSSNVGPVDPGAAAPNPNDPRGPLGPATVEAVTVIQTALVTASGDRIRLRLSNLHGAQPITVGAVTVAFNGAARPATVNGRSVFTLPAGAILLSDPIALKVAAMNRLSVSIAYPEPTALPVHRLRQVLRAADGRDAAPARLGALLSGIEVETTAPPGVIVAFGDSITEGTGSSPNGAGGWPERFAARLTAAHTPWAVINAGIGGNRLLHQGSGPSGLQRLDGDALAAPGARCLILLEGINDIGRPARPVYAHEAVTADDLIAGYRQVAARAHAAGFKVVLATIPPFEGANYFTASGEQARQNVNAWLRAKPEADAVIDFDAVLRDPAQPARLRSDLQSGDWLHPSDAGYAAMAAAIPLNVCG